MNADYIAGFGSAIIFCSVLAGVGRFNPSFLISGVVAVLIALFLVWRQSRNDLPNNP